MSSKEKVVGPTKIPTSNPVGDVSLRRVSGDGRDVPDLFVALLHRVRAAIARMGSRSHTGV
jgi:hypothetical protein